MTVNKKHLGKYTSTVWNIHLGFDVYPDEWYLCKSENDGADAETYQV